MLFADCFADWDLLGICWQLRNLAEIEDAHMLKLFRSSLYTDATSDEDEAELTEFLTERLTAKKLAAHDSMTSPAVKNMTNDDSPLVKEGNMETPIIKELSKEATQVKSKDSSEKLAVREALLDPEIAARALHSPDAMNLRNRAVV